MLEAAGVTVRFGDHVAVDDMTLRVADGQIVAVLGASGAGKSTLLRVIAGLLRPDAGTVVMDGVDISDLPAHQRNIGMMFQDEQLFPHLDVAGNIAFGPRVRKWPRADVGQRVSELLGLVGIDGFGHRRIDRLSGGERKRVALARSLAPRPTVLLLDEPLTGLDSELHDRLTTELGAVLRSTNTAAVLVTHDRDEATSFADVVVQWADLRPR
jgi:thiamine transport system ATP-binding protein